MTTAQWYRELVDKNITMKEDRDNHMQFVKTRAELASPRTDWELTWRRARMKGLGSEATSFLWKLLHQLLPTEERLSRILPNTSALCKFCPDIQVAANLEHCFFNCIKTKEVGSWLLSLIKQYDPTTSSATLIKLEFETSGATEMPLVWLTAHALLYIWGMRLNGKTASLILTRANLESKISLLRETRYSNEHLMLEEILARN